MIWIEIGGVPCLIAFLHVSTLIGSAVGMNGSRISGRSVAKSLMQAIHSRKACDAPSVLRFSLINSISLFIKIGAGGFKANPKGL